MSAGVYRPSYFIWWYAYCNEQLYGHAPPKQPSWRHAFIRFSEDGLILETLVPSAHHLHRGSELHHDAGGVAELQEVALTSEDGGDLILGEELNQAAIKRLQCAIEHAVLIQNASRSALVEFRNANERREFVNHAAQFILQSHVNQMSVSKHVSPSPQNSHVIANPKDSPTISRLQSKPASTGRVLSDSQPQLYSEPSSNSTSSSKRFVKIDLEDLSRSTSNAHQALSKLTEHLQTAIHKSQSPGNSLTYSSGDDEDAGSWDHWGFVPPEQHTTGPFKSLTSTSRGSDPAFSHTPNQQEERHPTGNRKSPSETTSNRPAQNSVSHGTQTSSVYQTISSKWLSKDAASSSHSARAKSRVPKSQLERNSITEMTSDWEKTLRSHLPVPNRAVSPYSPRRHISPPKSPRNVQFSATTQFVSSQASVDALLSEDARVKVHSANESTRLGSSSSPKRFSPAHNQKPEGSYAEWFEKKRAALAMVGSLSFREKKTNDIHSTNRIPAFKGGDHNSRIDSKASRRFESPRTPQHHADSHVSTEVYSSREPKSSSSSHDDKPRSRSAPKERKTVVVTPPRVWRIPDFDDRKSEGSESAPQVVKYRSINWGNGSVSTAQPKSALKSKSPQVVGKNSPQFFQLNQDDFVELISARESTLSPSLNPRQEPGHRQMQAPVGGGGGGGGAGGPQALSKQRRFSVFTKKKIAKLEPEISSYMSSPQFQSLPVRLQKAFAIGQQNKKPKDASAQPSFKP